MFELFKFIFIVQFAAIILPHAPVAFFHGLFWKLVYEYFNPNYTTALINGYKKPIIGLDLCSHCTKLRRWLKGCRMWHHGDLEHLKASAWSGCRLCQTVNTEFLQSIIYHDKPPPLAMFEDPSSHQVSMWFAEHTNTRSGFLDHLRSKSTTSYPWH